MLGQTAVQPQAQRVKLLAANAQTLGLQLQLQRGVAAVALSPAQRAAVR